MTPTFAAGAVLALALVSAPSAAQSATATLASDVVVVPMSHATRHVTVEVRVNGKGPYLFQVDTYASIDACVDDEFAEELGLEQIGTVMNSDGRVRRVKPIVLIDELVLGTRNSRASARSSTTTTSSPAPTVARCTVCSASRSSATSC